MTESTKSFIYRDARGRITARVLHEASESDAYFQGFCESASGLRTFRKDRILEFITDQVDVEARLKHHISTNPPPTESLPGTPRRVNWSGQPEICFTGFKKDRKSELSAAAEAASMFVRTSVTRDLDFLCCGDTAGPAKIAKARQQGVVALSETQFVALVETGEISDDD